MARLRAHEWDGDDDLADALEAQLGSGPARLLRPLAVDLEELAMVREGDPLHGGGRIDLFSAEVWPQEPCDQWAWGVPPVQGHPVGVAGPDDPLVRLR